MIDVTQGRGGNPRFGDYVNLMDEPERELVRDAFRGRARELGATLGPLYLSLEDGLDLGHDADVDIPALCATASPAVIETESRYWAARVTNPRNDDMVSRLFCFLHLRLGQCVFYARRRQVKRHQIN